jgi:uncharacterized repeat protein (TIGR03803 family)
MKRASTFSRIGILAAAILAIPPAWAQTYTELAVFHGDIGAYPAAGVIEDSTGNLYGTTEYGGASNEGVVLKLDTAGTITVLHSFMGAEEGDGGGPTAGVIQDSAGNLYGTTTAGGTEGSGVVFKLDSSGSETVLHSFCSPTNCDDGELPYAGVILDSAGNLYGTTYYGGASGNGVVFKLATSGTLTVLHSFTGADGQYRPQA